MSDQQEVCPHCGSANIHHSVQLHIEFDEQVYKAIELLAARRKESVEDLLFHLLWLELNKVPAARKLLEHHEH